ncbi:MAG TPA: hypothetical protein VGD66_08475 [Allosphingosinicella sp.]|jgi:hypothetical protein
MRRGFVQASFLAMAAVAMGLAAGGAMPPTPRSLGQEPLRGPFKIKAVSMSRALEIFRTVCIDTFPNRRAFNRAVAGAGLGFVRETPFEGAEYQWGDGARYFAWARQRRPDGSVERMCRFRVAVHEELTEKERMDAIGSALAPGLTRREISGLAFWELGGQPATTLELLPASPDTRLFDLEISRVESRAH